MPLPAGLDLCAEHDRIGDHAISFQEMLMDSVKARRGSDYRQERHLVETPAKRRHSSEYRSDDARRVRFARPIATYNDENSYYRAASKAASTHEGRRETHTCSPVRQAESYVPRHVSRSKPIVYQHALMERQNGQGRRQNVFSCCPTPPTPMGRPSRRPADCVRELATLRGLRVFDLPLLHVTKCSCAKCDQWRDWSSRARLQNERELGRVLAIRDADWRQAERLWLRWSDKERCRCSTCVRGTRLAR